MGDMDDLNRTELADMCRAAGLGSVGRTQDREQIYSVLEGTADPSEIECPLEGKRKMMQQQMH